MGNRLQNHKRESAIHRGGDGVSTKFTQRQQALIVADYAECRSYAAVGRKYKTSDKTIKRIVAAQPDMAQIAEQKAENNRADIMAYMDSRATQVKKFIDIFVGNISDPKKVNALNLDKQATVFGIVFDKFCRPAQQIDLNAEGIVVTLEGDIKKWGG